MIATRWKMGWAGGSNRKPSCPAGSCIGCGAAMFGRKRKYCTKACYAEYSNPRRHTMTCEHCGERFAAASRKRKFCSHTCSNRMTWGVKRRRPDVTCQQCGVVYWATAPDRETFCSRGCAFWWSKEQARYRNEMKAWAAEYYYYQVRVVRSCRVCRGEFVPATVRSWACSSEECKWRQASGTLMKCLKCGADREFHKSYCLPCGLAELREQRSEYRRRRRARMRGSRVEVFKRREILERDGYRCQECGCKTRPDWNVNHDKYPHLDHIVPLAKGGSHTRVNTQCLCRKCNLSKSDSEGGQMRLIA